MHHKYDGLSRRHDSVHHICICTTNVWCICKCICTTNITNIKKHKMDRVSTGCNLNSPRQKLSKKKKNAIVRIEIIFTKIHIRHINVGIMMKSVENFCSEELSHHDEMQVWFRYVASRRYMYFLWRCHRAVRDAKSTCLSRTAAVGHRSSLHDASS